MIKKEIGRQADHARFVFMYRKRICVNHCGGVPHSHLLSLPTDRLFSLEMYLRLFVSFLLPFVLLEMDPFNLTMK